MDVLGLQPPPRKGHLRQCWYHTLEALTSFQEENTFGSPGQHRRVTISVAAARLLLPYLSLTVRRLPPLARRQVGRREGTREGCLPRQKNRKWESGEDRAENRGGSFLNDICKNVFCPFTTTNWVLQCSWGIAKMTWWKFDKRAS